MTAANCRSMLTTQVAFAKQANYVKVMYYLLYSLVWFDITAKGRFILNKCSLISHDTTTAVILFFFFFKECLQDCGGRL